MIRPSRRFIALDRNPDIEPAQWPFRRAALAIEAGTGETTVELARSEGRKRGPKGNAQNQSRYP